jgi:hypothetical protein
MTTKILVLLAAMVAAQLFGAQPTLADSMKCSGEQKTCIAACQKMPRGLVGDCIANCRARTNYCKLTGCWDNGTKRYCGLLRQ